MLQRRAEETQPPAAGVSVSRQALCSCPRCTADQITALQEEYLYMELVPPDAWPGRERRHVLFHSSWQTSELSTTKGRSWWAGRRPQMCSCKRLPLLIKAENSQSMPRNTVCQQNLFLLLFTNKPYSMLRLQDWQSKSTLNRFILNVCLIKQQAPDSALNTISKNRNTF